jgi:putative Mg2+ transporter-C (MgtC) family protein
MGIVTEDIFKLLLSIVLGGLIGAEREYHDKTAGFRTIIFICVGATLFTIFSGKIGGNGDPRIAANIVSGVGFLGAGVILRANGRIVGLTTAAMIWLSAGIGMGVGAGQYIFVSFAAAIVLIVLWFFPMFEDWIDKKRDSRAYEVTCKIGFDQVEKIEEIFKSFKLSVKRSKQFKNNDREMVCIFFTSGKPRNHEQAIKKLLDDDDVKAFHF